MTSAQPTTEADEWWRNAVVYQVYPRSFSDGNGDGVGDIAGIRARLPYLARLGVDAIWVNPWYPSPMKDAGYDVSDFRAIDPVFGTLADAQKLLDEAHRLGIRVLVDLVPNHTSDQHPWFQAALAAAPGSPERELFHFRDGRGDDGGEPPNDWVSEFGGPAWSRTVDLEGRPGQWYLRLYAHEQPDLNWDNPAVAADLERTLRFWFDLGVDGFRIDVANGLVKDRDLADVGDLGWPLAPDAEVEHPHWDREGVHEIYRSWRRIGDSYDPPRVFAAEVWVGRPHRLVRYLRPDELHTAFNFDYLVCPWRADLLRSTIDATIASHATVGAPPTWVLSNHDVPREVSRYARPQPDHLVRLTVSDLLRMGSPDLQLGRRRARAAALLMLALPGSAYVYQGAELGLSEVEDIADERLQDPVFAQTAGAERGRDGCRVPLPWSGNEPPYGFSPAGSSPSWLPQPPDWASVTVQAEEGDPRSMLELYRTALAVRRRTSELRSETLSWRTSPPGTLHLTRGRGFACLVNVDGDPVPLPDGAGVVLASGDLDEHGRLPADTAVWLQVTPV